MGWGIYKILWYDYQGSHKRALEQCSATLKTPFYFWCGFINHKYPFMFNHSTTLRFCSSDLPDYYDASVLSAGDQKYKKNSTIFWNISLPFSPPPPPTPPPFPSKCAPLFPSLFFFRFRGFYRRIVDQTELREEPRSTLLLPFLS